MMRELVLPRDIDPAIIPISCNSTNTPEVLLVAFSMWSGLMGVSGPVKRYPSDVIAAMKQGTMMRLWLMNVLIIKHISVFACSLNERKCDYLLSIE